MSERGPAVECKALVPGCIRDSVLDVSSPGKSDRSGKSDRTGKSLASQTGTVGASI